MKRMKIYLMVFALAASVRMSAQSYSILDFEDEDETAMTIADLHTGDWQTNPNYVRNTFAINPDKSGVNQTDRCATFSGYNSDAEWWYGLDIVLSEPIPLTEGLKYVHVAMMTNNITVDTNRGLLLRGSAGGGTDLKELWLPITDSWSDYVFPLPDGASDLMELRLMCNHKISGEITYIDEILINNDPNPRTNISTGIKAVTNNQFIDITTVGKTITVSSSANDNHIEAYDALGKCIYNRRSNAHTTSFNALTTGLIVLKVNGKVYKTFVNS